MGVKVGGGVKAVGTEVGLGVGSGVGCDAGSGVGSGVGCDAGSGVGSGVGAKVDDCPGESSQDTAPELPAVGLEKYPAGHCGGRRKKEVGGKGG